MERTLPRRLAWRYNDLARLVALALLIAVGLLNVAQRAMNWTAVDIDVYRAAAEYLVSEGNPYITPEHIAPDATYRYAPWFAVLWIPSLPIPRDLVAVAWSLLTVGASVVVIVDVVRRWGYDGWPMAAFFGSLLISVSAAGNVQSILIAAVYFGLRTRWGPWIVGIAASLKFAPILLVIPWLKRGEWRRAVLAVGVAGALTVPVLLFEVPSQIIVSGSASLLSYGLAVWLGVVIAVVLLAFAARPTRWAWAAAGLAVVVALPRSIAGDLTWMLGPALAEPRRRDG